MPLSNVCAVIHVFVMFVLTTNVAYAPSELWSTLTTGEQICLIQIERVFGSMTDVKICVNNAIQYLYSDSPTIVKNLAAGKYFHELKVHVYSDQVLDPPAFCIQHFGASTSAPSTDKKIAEYGPVQRCIDTLEYYFEGMPIIRIVRVAYDKESINLRRYVELYPQYHKMNPQFPYIVASYVKHISEKFTLFGEPLTPIQFCCKNVSFWGQIISKGNTTLTFIDNKEK